MAFQEVETITPMKNETSIIQWTLTDEAPALATYSFLPIVRAFLEGTGIEVESRDISLAGRILASFPDRLGQAQRVPDHLALLSDLTHDPAAIIVKLPNISASVPQVQEAVRELRSHGYDVPEYPENPGTDGEKKTQERFAKVLGSAVNPVLREGNSDRRSPLSVKAFSRKHPHKLAAWAPDSKTHVAHMSSGDFYGSELSVTVPVATDARIEFVGADGTTAVLKPRVKLVEGEIVDASSMSVRSLREFFALQIAD